MFTDYEALMRSYKCILVNYQVVSLPQNWSQMDWFLWRADSANIIVSKTYFLEGSIEVSTVFLPQSAGDHFETMIFGEPYENEQRWETYHEAWLGHLVVAMIVDLQILKLRGATPALACLSEACIGAYS